MSVDDTETPSFCDLTIVTKADAAKGRSFTATLYAHVQGDGLWSGGEGAKDNVRPVLAVLGASEAQAGPFAANLRSGYKATTWTPGANNRYANRDAMVFEWLRSAGYAWPQQRHPEGVILQPFLSELYRIDPGMVDPAGVTFALLPARAWTEAHRGDLGAMIQHLPKAIPSVASPLTLPEVEQLANLASLFLVYLDRRTHCPLVPDPRFALQVLVAGLAEGLISRSANKSQCDDLNRGYRSTPAWGRGLWGYAECGVEIAGFHPGLAMHAKHGVLEPFLAQQVARYFAAVGTGKKPARPGRGKRLMVSEDPLFAASLGASPDVAAIAT